jgi:hypothetical protein
LLYGSASSDKIRGDDGFDTINGGTGPDLICWGKDDGGVDTDRRFMSTRTSCGSNTGFFHNDVAGPINSRGRARRVPTPDRMPFSGPIPLKAAGFPSAAFTNVDANALSMKIANGSILPSSTGRPRRPHRLKVRHRTLRSSATAADRR